MASEVSLAHKDGWCNQSGSDRLSRIFGGRLKQQEACPSCFVFIKAKARCCLASIERKKSAEEHQLRLLLQMYSSDFHLSIDFVSRRRRRERAEGGQRGERGAAAGTGRAENRKRNRNPERKVEGAEGLLQRLAGQLLFYLLDLTYPVQLSD